MGIVHVVQEDGTIVVTVLDESEIKDILDSDYYSTVFKINAGAVEYAKVDPNTGLFVWKESELCIL